MDNEERELLAIERSELLREFKLTLMLLGFTNLDGILCTPKLRMSFEGYIVNIDSFFNRIYLTSTGRILLHNVFTKESVDLCIKYISEGK